MNPQNLTHEEIKLLHALLGKMLEQPETEVDPIDKMIDNIINEFDFIKVQTTMDCIGWKWLGQHVTIDMLKSEARRLLRGAAVYRLGEYRDVHWEQGIINGSGGFVATAWCDEDKTKITMLNLQFVLTEWDCELQDLDNK